MEKRGSKQKELFRKITESTSSTTQCWPGWLDSAAKYNRRDLGLYFCLFRISIFLCLLLFCLCFLLIINRKNIHVLAEIKALFMSHHIKKKRLITGFLCLVSTHLLLFSCTLHRLCIRLLSRGHLLCSSCTENVAFKKKISTTPSSSHSKIIFVFFF